MTYKAYLINPDTQTIQEISVSTMADIENLLSRTDPWWAKPYTKLLKPNTIYYDGSRLMFDNGPAFVVRGKKYPYVKGCGIVANVSNSGVFSDVTMSESDLNIIWKKPTESFNNMVQHIMRV